MTDQNAPHRPNVFVSHTWKDMDFTKRVVEQLKEWGYNVWWDYETLRGGQQLWAVIEKLINVSDVFLVLLSESAMTSEGVQREILWADYRTMNENSQKKKLQYFIPAVIRKCEFRDRLMLRTRNYIKLARRWEEGFQELKRALPQIPLAVVEPVQENIIPAHLRETSDEEIEIREAIKLLGNAYAARGKEHFDEVVSRFKAAIEESILINNERILLDAELGLGIYLSYRGQTENALVHLQKARKLAKKYGDVIKQAESERNEGIVLTRLSKYSDANVFFKSAMALYKRFGYDWGIAATYSNIAKIYLDKSKFQEAMSNYKESLTIFEKINDESNQASTLGEIANVYKNKSEYSSALEYYNKALEVFLTQENLEGQVSSMLGIAIIYEILDKFDESLELYNKALKITERLGDKTDQAKIFVNMSILHMNHKEYEKAKKLLKEAIELFELFGDVSGLSISQANLANVHFNIGEYGEALKLHEATLRNFKAGGNENEQARSLCNIANIKKILGYFEEALKFYLESIEIFKRLGDVHGFGDACLSVALLYLNKLGDPLNARKYANISLESLSKINAPMKETAKEFVLYLNQIVDDEE